MLILLTPSRKRQSAFVRVLLLNQVFYPDPQATSQYSSRLAEELVRRGHAVTVLAGRRDYNEADRLYPEQETWCGVEIIRVWNTGYGHGSKFGLLLDFLTFLLSALLRGLLLPRADVVLALTTPPLVSVLGALLAKFQGARFVYWVMDLNPDEAVAVGWLKADSMAARLLEKFSRWSLQQAQQVIVPDVYMSEHLQGKGVTGEKIEVIPLWSQSEVMYDPVGRECFRREHGLSDRYVVMYSGNHTPCHSLKTLVKAARLLQDERKIHFCFVGGGIEWGRMRDQARNENWDNSTFLGYQPFAELSGLLSAADVQVVVMGDAFVGIVHPCKVYNFLAARRPFIYVGPERSHVTDLIQEAGLENVAASFRHGEGEALANVLRARSDGVTPIWSDNGKMTKWSETRVLAKLVELVEFSSLSAQNPKEG